MYTSKEGSAKCLNQKVALQSLTGVVFFLLSISNSVIGSAGDDIIHIELEQFVVVSCKEGTCSKEKDEVRIPILDHTLHRSGTVIEYVVTVKNINIHPVGDIVLNPLIPEWTFFLNGVDQSDETVALVQFSIDGGKQYRANPIVHTTVRDAGTGDVAPATPNMYTHMRIIFLKALEFEEEVEFRYRVEVK